MARTLSGSTSTAIAQVITQPRWFLEVAFSTVLRLTTGATQVWNGQTWTEARFEVSGIAWDGSIRADVSIEFHDPDSALLALAATQKLTDRAIKLWLYEAGVTGAADPIAMPVLKGITYEAPADYRTRYTAGIGIARVLPRGSWRTAVPDALFVESNRVYRWGSGTLELLPRGEV